MGKVAPLTQERRLLRLIHVGKRELDLDDDTYRNLLERITGARSCKGLPVAKLEAVLAEMRAKGFHVQQRRAPRHTAGSNRSPRISKIIAIWCAMRDAGVLDNPSFKALDAWCDQHTGGKPLKWAGTDELNACIEGLKSWAAREGVELVD